MGIDVMIVGPAEAMASRPSDEMLGWLEERFEDYSIRYGYIVLDEDAALELAARFARDAVGAMLLRKITEMREQGGRPPYVIELMVGW